MLTIAGGILLSALVLGMAAAIVLKIGNWFFVQANKPYKRDY